MAEVQAPDDPNDLACNHRFKQFGRGFSCFYFWCSRATGHSGCHGETFKDCSVVDTRNEPPGKGAPITVKYRRHFPLIYPMDD